MPGRARKKSPRRSRGFRVIRWIEANCVHTQGEWIGRPFKLLAWQRELLLELFEVTAADVRRYRWALIGTAKKAGKTELMAALALYLLIGDGEPAPMGAVAAASDEQADLVFGAVKTMCKLSPTLSLVCEVFDREVLVPSIPGAKLRRVAAAAGTNDGPSYSFVILDELHQWTGVKGEAVWNVLTNSTGARRQPLILQITTAGVAGTDTVCERQYLHGVQVSAGSVSDPTFFFRWYQAPEGVDYKSEKAWKAANPSYGVIVRKEFYEDQLQRKPENVFRRYFTNAWTQTTDSWISPERWAACTGEERIPDGAEVYLGVDVGLVNDSTAVSWCSRLEDGRYVIAARVWASRRETAAHVYVPGGRVQLEPVEAFIQEMAGRYLVREVAYDPRFFERSAQALSALGVQVTAMDQGTRAMADAVQRFFGAVVERRIVHDGDEVLAAHVLGTAADATDRGWKVRKLRQSQKIDACVAAIMAVNRGEHGESAWSGDLVTVLA